MVSSWSLFFSPLYLGFYAGRVCNPETSTIKKKKKCSNKKFFVCLIFFCLGVGMFCVFVF